jgi:hypothetical protein
MKAVSLYQPWASFCVVPDPEFDYPLKPDETRSWAAPATLVGQRIAIHATKGCPLGERPVTPAGTFQPPFAELLDRIGYRNLDPWCGAFSDPEFAGYGGPKMLPLGAVVGVVTLEKVQPADQRARYFTGTLFGHIALQLGDYSARRYAWVFRDPRALVEPIPCKGHQGIWTVPEHVAHAINARLVA